MANNIAFKAVIGTLFGSGILAFMGYGIINNEIRNVKEHTEIRKEQVNIRREANEGDERLNKKIDEVKKIVTDVRLEQRELTTIVKERFRIE